MAIIASTLARIKSDPLCPLGGKQHVNELFAQAGHVWRERVFDPATTLGLFILQVLHGNTAITHLRHLCNFDVRPQSYCDARARLPLLTLAWVIEQWCRDCIKYTQDTAATWLGRRVFLADATTATTPDTPELQSLWPQPSVQKPGCGFPMIKLLGLLDLATGMIVQLSLFCLHTHEMSQAAAMTAMLRAGDVLLADRGFCSFVHLALLALKEIDAVFRMHQRQIVDFTPNRPHQRGGRKRRKRGVPTSRFVRRLGPDDQIVEWLKPSGKPQWMTQQEYDRLSATLLIRELRYRIIVPGRRTRIVTIATTLVDPMRYPKRKIAELYGLRWEIETNFRHLKQTMKMDQLKCKTADGVMKELLLFALVYNLVRAAMCAAAARQGADPNRVSFIDTLRWLWSDRTAEEIKLVLNRIRPGRWCPRVKKRRMKEYDLMTKLRSQYIQPQSEDGLTA
jgi:hypothetical protein